MPEKKEPLEIILQRKRNHSEKAVIGGTEILREVLANLGYTGKWQACFRNQNAKKDKDRFKAAHLSGPRSILVRTKSGDSGTGWDVLLYPPKQYKIETVLGALQRINPHNLTVKPIVQKPVPKEHPIIDRVRLNPETARNIGIDTARDVAESIIPNSVKQELKDLSFQLDMKQAIRATADERAKKITDAKIFLTQILRKNPVQESIILQCAEAKGIERTILERAAGESGIIKENNEWRIHVPVVSIPTPVPTFQTKREELAAIKESLSEVEKEIEERRSIPEKINPFKLRRESTLPLNKDNRALDQALVVIALQLSPDGRYIGQKEAVEILEEKMELQEYLTMQQHYTWISRITSSLLKGLCDKKYLFRYLCEGDSTHTKGFELLSDGMARIQRIYETNSYGIGDPGLACWMPGYKPEIRHVEPVVAPPVPLVPVEPMAAKTVDVDLEKIHKNLDAFVALDKESTKAQESITIYTEMVNQTTADAQAKKATVNALKAAYTSLREQLETLGGNLEIQERELKQLEKELLESQQAKENEIHNLEEIKGKITAMLEKS